MSLQAAQTALDGASNGVGTTTHQRITGVGREVSHLPSGYLETRCAALQRTVHQAKAGQDQATKKTSCRIHGIHGHGRTHHHCKHGRHMVRVSAQRMLARPNDRSPAI